MAPAERHVPRLDVAVDDAAGVSVAQGVGRLRGDSQRVIHRQLPLAPQPAAQRLALSASVDSDFARAHNDKWPHRTTQVRSTCATGISRVSKQVR